MLPLCFVLMPPGLKVAADGIRIDFDAIYDDLVAPGVAAAQLEPIRANREPGGVIDVPLCERLLLCEFAVADLTTADRNVFYELGLRQAVRPASTLLLFAAGSGPPSFDVEWLRALPYHVGSDGRPLDAGAVRETITKRLCEAREHAAQASVYHLVESFPDIQRLKTDVFRERVDYCGEVQARLATARRHGIEAVREMEATLGKVADLEAAVVLDLYLSYRATGGWKEMIALVAKMSAPLARSVLVQEQLGFALNRDGRRQEAAAVLLAVIAKHGASSETCALLGRVYKDGWETAAQAGQSTVADGLLGQAIDAYLQGFEADWRDAYPGINAVTLMEVREPPDPRRERLIPVVAYAVERRLAAGKADYWDHAARLELAILGKDPAAARVALGAARAAVRELWEPETTARNLGLIRAARDRRGEPLAWALDIERSLQQLAAQRSVRGAGLISVPARRPADQQRTTSAPARRPHSFPQPGES